MLCAPSPNLVFWKAPVQKSEKNSVKKSEKFSSKTSKNPLSRILKPSLPKYLQEICHCLCGREGPLTPLTGIWFSDKITECCSSCFFSPKMRRTGFWSFVQKQRWIENWIRYELTISLKSGLLFEILLDQSLVTVWALTKVLLACSQFQFFFRELSFLVVPRAGPIR